MTCALFGEEVQRFVLSVSSVCDHGGVLAVGEVSNSPEIARLRARVDLCKVACSFLFVEAIPFVIKEDDRVGSRFLNARMDFVSCKFRSSCDSAAVLAVELQEVRNGFLV